MKKKSSDPKECPICGGSHTSFFRPFVPGFRRMERIIFSNTDMLSCDGCKHVFEHPMPPEHILQNFYESFYWEDHRNVSKFTGPQGPLETWRDTRAIGQNAFYVPHLLEQHGQAAPIRVLDIGAGGALAVRRLGLKFEVSIDVIEPSDEYTEYYVDSDLNRISRSLDGLTLSEYAGTYDLISSSHVLEHVRNPVAFTEAAKAMTKPGGLVFFEVPNCNEDWNDAVRSDSPHIQFFNKSSMLKLFSRVDLDVLAVVETGFSTTEMLRMVDKKMTREEMLAINKLGEQNTSRRDGSWLRILGRKA